MILDKNTVKGGAATPTELEQAPKMSFVVMPRYGINVEQYFEATKTNFSKVSAYYIGYALLQLFEQVHRAGYVFNDLKPDNLMTCLDHSI